MVNRAKGTDRYFPDGIGDLGHSDGRSTRILRLDSRCVARVIDALFENRNCHRAIMFLSPKLVVRAKRILYKSKIDRRIERQHIYIVVKIGQPNYRERRFIKDCLQVGVPFPVQKIQLQFAQRK